MVTTSLEAHRSYFEGLRCLERPSQGDSSWVFPDCEAHFERALEIDPDFPQAHLELARQAFWAGAPRSELRASLVKALARLDRVPPRERPLLLAWKAWLDGDEAGALATLAAGESAFPDEAHVALARGDLLFRSGRYDEAIGPLDRAWRLDPGLELAPDMLIGCLGVLDRMEPLRALVGRLAGLPPAPGNLHAELQARAWLGEHAEALALARRAAVGGGRAAREDLVEALAAAGSFDEAERVALTLGPEPPTGRRLLGNLLVLQGRLRAARPHLDPTLPAGVPALDRYILASRRAIPLSVQRDAAGVRQLVEATRRDSLELAADLAPKLAYAGDTDRALALREPLAQNRASLDLLDALVAWRRNGASAGLPGLRRLLRGEPRVVTASLPPEMIPWLVAEAALEAEGPEAALMALRRFQRFYMPLGFGRVWLLPRALVLEARLLDRLGRRGEAREALARFESLWRRADPDLPLLAEARALRSALGPGGAPGTEAPAGRGR
jgi:tetratricopeptide (TPR) repeat protein